MGFRMITYPEDFSCATRRSATILDIVSAACDRANALPLVRASASAVLTSRGSAGVSFSSGGTYCRISNGATFASGTRAKATQISARVCSIFCESGTVALTTAEPIALRLASSLFLRDAGEFRDGLAPQRSP
jgi:hypothetical protein